ncbi:MAG TPA: ice-binding family protein [Treponemataceae bacterium]|nr:ice-binding family protein [Treponemataceae bacterium]
MRKSTIRVLLALAAILTVFSFASCDMSGPAEDTSPPTVTMTTPLALATNVSINSSISARFSEAMDPNTVVALNFTLTKSSSLSVPVLGNVVYDLPNTTARFSPKSNLENNTEYTATITTSVKDKSGNSMAQQKVWTFTTATVGLGPAPVALGTALNFVMLAKTGISSVPASVITGDIGVSPAAESFLTGFSQTKATGYSTSPQVTGFLYAADMTPPTPIKMTTAISDMETAYNDAKNRITPNFTNLGSGEIGGKTLTPGLYSWGTSVTISSDVTISGGANDVWIFQTSGDLTMSDAFNVVLTGGAQAKNIFWQVAGKTTLGTTAHFEGVILCQTSITLNTGASMNGKALAQTLVALDMATVTDVE